MNSKKIYIISLVAIVVIIFVLLTMSSYITKYNRDNHYNQEISNVQTISNLSSFNNVTDNVKINKETNTITFEGNNIIIPFIASPDENNMFAYGVYGLVNPNIVVKKDAKITIKLINKDDDKIGRASCRERV